MPEIVIFLLLILAAVWLLFVKGRGYKSIGQTKGICVKVETVISETNDSPYNEQMRGKDPRSYRPYIRYSWEGKEYIAKSFFAYGTAKYFPGDEVEILVNRDDKGIVKICGPVQNI